MIKKIYIVCVRSVSMTFRALGWRACRFHPTCSEYSVQAFDRFGGWKAAWFSLTRVLRCQPLSRGGYDPVPEK